MGVKVVKLKPLMSVEDSDKMAGVLLKATDCKTLFREDVDVYDKESGKCIAKFRRGIVPGWIQKQAYDSLLVAVKQTDNRGTATKKNEKGRASKRKVLLDGTISKTVRSAEGPVNSGIVGYFDRNPRFPYCRLTAFNQQNLQKFKDAYPIIKLVDKKYSELMPEFYKKQRALADRTSQDFVIPNTAFTTVTVNRNWQTAVHKDAGDFKEGFGNLVAIRNGDFDGGYFVVARWGVGFDMQNGDLLMVDVHQWHGNTPIVKIDPRAVRLSLVMYYRENMVHCGTMKEELKRVKNRKRGSKLNG